MQTLHKIWLPLVLLVSLHTVAKGQPTHYSVGGTAGMVIATNGSPFDGRSPTGGIDVAALWSHKDTSVFWHRFWDEPMIGVRANYAHIWNSVAGDRLGLAWTLNGPLLGHLSWTYSVGLSMYTKPYSVTHDTTNSFIGSPLNCLIDLGFMYELPLSERLTAALTAKLVHSSNGYLYKPNHGLNYLQAELGLRYGPARRHYRHRPSFFGDSTFHGYGRPFLLVAPGAVMSRYDDLDDIIYYPTYLLQLGYIRQVHPCFAIGGALDLSYNFSHRRMAPTDELPVYPAAFGFFDTQWGPLTLRLGLAHYLAYYPLNWEQYYERVAVYYRIGNAGHHLVGAGMKVHYDHIDFIEWSYIYEF